MILCVTGQMAAGKNYVCSKIMEQNHDFVSIDMDKTVHEAINLCQEQIFSAFRNEAEKAGISLKNPDGSLNRRNLGKLIFPEPELLKRQESIVYPKTVELTEKFINENRAEGKSVILNATVLYKIPELVELCEKIVFVKANFFKRLFRARKRDKMPLFQILNRFKAQKNLLSMYKSTGKEIVIIRN